MSFTRAKLTNWIRGDKLTGIEINKIADDLVKAVDGIGGGSYNNSPITLQGNLAVQGILDPALIRVNTTFIRWIQSAPVADRAEWSLGNYGINAPYSLTTNRSPITWYLGEIPNGAVITDITAYVQAHSGHGALPAQPAGLIVESYAPSSRSYTAIATVGDPSANTASYESAHAISSGAISVTVDHTASWYAISVLNESSTNAVAGLRVDGVKITYTMSYLDKGR